MAHIEKLGRVMVPVADQDAAITWYRDKLGFELVADVPFGDNDRWVEVAPAAGGPSVALVPPRGDHQPGLNTGIGFETADARSLHAALRANGVEVEDELMGGDGTVPPLFFFRDGDGNHLMVAEVE